MALVEIDDNRSCRRAATRRAAFRSARATGRGRCRSSGNRPWWRGRSCRAAAPCERSTEEGLGGAAPVDVGGIDEVDALRRTPRRGRPAPRRPRPRRRRSATIQARFPKLRDRCRRACGISFAGPPSPKRTTGAEPMPFRRIALRRASWKEPRLMFDDLRRADEIPAAELKSLPEEVLNSGRPMVLRGAVADWPFVQAALQSDEAAVEYLIASTIGEPVTVLAADPSEEWEVLLPSGFEADELQASPGNGSRTCSARCFSTKSRSSGWDRGASDLRARPLPGLEEENPNRFVPEGTHARVWIGNAVTVSPHFDVADNIACVSPAAAVSSCSRPSRRPTFIPGPWMSRPRTCRSAWCRWKIPTSTVFRVTVRRSPRRSLPSWSRGMPSTSPICGGTASSRLAVSTF